MDPERWSEVRALFDRVVELDEARCRAELDRLRTGDPDLVAEVESMLASDGGTEWVLDGGVSSLLETPPAASANRRVGRYRLVELLGTGGMGAVWRAERADGAYESQVALKLVRTGFSEERLARRFVHERQILADLRHPNIARLLDGGTTDDGAPYLVMELVDGVPINQWCAEQRATVEERLRLFLQVCAAVEFAHRRMVVHRDIKPGNILVDRDGTPKLLDFGIAKLLDPEEMGDFAGLTHTGLQLHTPRYASPEQLLGQPVTVATDVYSLGILLHELLTGVLPFASAGTSPAAALDRDPTRPSVVVAEGEIPPGLPPSPERARRRLRGDLDTIVLTALHRDLDRRYGSAEALARDVERHLDGRPVEARPDRVGYRMAKFVRRNRVGVAVAAAFALLLMGSSVLLALQARRVTRERDLAEAERAKAEQVSEFLVGVFEANDPSAAQGVEMTAGEILSRGARRIETDLVDQPEVRATVLDAIGGAYQNLGVYDSAAVVYDRSLKLREESLGTDHPDTYLSLARAGTIARLQGRLDDAVSLHRRALEGRRAYFGPAHRDVASSLSALGLAVRQNGDDDEAEQLYREALRIQREVLEPDAEDIARTLNNLSGIYDARGMADSAMALLEESIAIRRAGLGTEHLDFAISVNNLATAYENAGRYEEAEALYRQSLALRERLLEPGHPMVLTVQNNLAVLFIRTGRAEEAEPFMDAVVEGRRGNPEERLALATVLSNRGAARYRLDRPLEASADFQEALALMEAEVGPDHPMLAYPLSGLARTQEARGRWREAEASLERCLALRAGAYEPPHALIANSLEALGSFYLGRGRLGEADARFTAALEMRRELLAPDHPDLADALVGLGEVRLEQGDSVEARTLLTRGHAILAEQLSPEDPRLRGAIRALERLESTDPAAAAGPPPADSTGARP